MCNRVAGFARNSVAVAARSECGEQMQRFAFSALGLLASADLNQLDLLK
jgi:hypothetical protein